MVDPRINDVANLAKAIYEPRLTKVSSLSEKYKYILQEYIHILYMYIIQAQVSVQIQRNTCCTQHALLC